jgi:hypothetical protein
MIDFPDNKFSAPSPGAFGADLSPEGRGGGKGEAQ